MFEVKYGARVEPSGLEVLWDLQGSLKITEEKEKPPWSGVFIPNVGTREQTGSSEGRELLCFWGKMLVFWCVTSCGGAKGLFQRQEFCLLFLTLGGSPGVRY